MNKFLETVNANTVIQGGIAGVLAGTICALLLTGQDAPKELWVAFATVTSFYFGIRNGQSSAK